MSDEEALRLQKQLDDVLRYVDKLKEVDVTAVEPSAHAVSMFNVTRADETRPGLTVEEALANTARKANNLFVVPKVIE